MAEYYLKTSSYVFRLTYRQDGANYVIDETHAAGTGTLPDGTVLEMVDQAISEKNVIVAQILDIVSDATVADYRTAAKAQIDASW